MPPADGRRVGYVVKRYPRLAETFILNEILAHEAAGLELEIFSLRSPIDGCFHHDLARVKAQVTYVPGPSVKAEEFWPTVGRAHDTLADAETIFEVCHGESAGDVYQAILLAEAVRERGVCHLHAHFATVATSVARLAARLAGIPYTFTAHAKDIYDNSVDENQLRRKLRDAATVVTVSDYNVEYLRERFGADAATVQRVYNGLDLQDFTYCPPHDRPALVVGVGRLVDKKGFKDLIDACAVLTSRGRDYQCEIIGHGVLHAQLAEQLSRLGLGDRVRLLGPLPRSEVIERVRRAALLATPCVVSEHGNRDGLPTVLLEAMALGTPCISTAVTGIPELVRNGETGLIAEQHDPASLADEIERLLDDPALRVRLAANARRVIEAEFDIHRNTPVLRAIFAAASAREPRVALEVG